MVNYTLKVNHSSSDVWNQSVSPEEENDIHNLIENIIYSFEIIVSNSVGVVSTKRSQICELFPIFSDPTNFMKPW